MKIIPYVRFTTYYTSFRGWKYHRGYKILQPGDIILTVDKMKFTSFLVPGEFTHSAICVAKDAEWEISEMTHRNYTKSTFFDLCRESDRVVLLRCNAWDDKYIKSVISKCRSFENVSYDVAFELGVETLYCSEMIYHSDHEHRLRVSLEDIDSLGREYISPTGLFMAENGYVAWDSDDEDALDWRSL